MFISFGSFIFLLCLYLLPPWGISSSQESTQIPGIYLNFTDDPLLPPLYSSALSQASYFRFHRAADKTLSWVEYYVLFIFFFFLTPFHFMSITLTNFPINIYMSDNVIILLLYFVLFSPFSHTLARYESLSWHLSSLRTLEEFHHCVLRFSCANEKYNIGFIPFLLKMTPGYFGDFLLICGAPKIS